ncbi:hypothetical protein ACET3Z_007298 [Daucus carota]
MAASPPNTPYWVFLSFRGQDTRNNITSHLYRNLNNAGVKTFRDDDALRRGEEISAGLLNAIRASKICVIVFSRNYGDSKWCLDELHEIMESKRNNEGQVVVIPVFYNVDPSDVRHQIGTFRQAFQKHEERHGAELVRKWRNALTTASNLSGYDLQQDAHGNEGDLVQKVVAYVRQKLQPIIDKMYAVQLPADKLEIDHGNNSRKWNWFVDGNDRIPSWWTSRRLNNDNWGEGTEIAEVMKVYWLHIAGEYEENLLTPGWTYEVHFVVKLKQDLEMERTAKLILDAPNGTSQESRENLMGKPRDQWIEIKVGEFKAQNHGGKVEFSLYASEDDTIRKRGIYVLGAQIVPVFFPRINMYEYGR